MAAKTGAVTPVGKIRTVRDAWRRHRHLVVEQPSVLALLALASVVAGLAEAALLAIIAAAAAALSAGASAVEADVGPVAFSAELPLLFAAGFCLAIVRALSQLLVAYLPARMSARAIARLRTRLLDAFTRASWPVQAKERDGHFQAMMGGHVSNSAQAIIALGQGLSALLVFLTLVVSAFVVNVATAVVLVVLAVGLFLLLQPVSRRLRRASRELSGEQVEFTKRMQEVVRMAEETQVFGFSDAYERDLQQHIERVRKPHLRTRFLSRLIPVLYQSVALLLLLAALVVVAVLDVAEVTALGAVVLILVRSTSYGQQVQAAITRFDELLPYMDRLHAALDDYTRAPRQDGTDPLPSVVTVGMRNVRFRYDDKRDVLAGLSFEVRAGEAVGIVGPSGAGKSTLVQLLLRLRDPDEGQLLVNGQDARRFLRDQWQRRVAYVPQTPQLIHGTVAENIRFYRPWITDEAVERAARRAHVHDEILSWDKGYDTVVDQRGAAVSGGQRQRLCLARGLAGEPDVLVLDEPTSALDVRSEMLVTDSLRDLKGEVTLFLVAHRLSTLAVCTRVMVVVDGQLQAMDRPDQLVDTNDFYREATSITRQQSGP